MHPKKVEEIEALVEQSKCISEGRVAGAVVAQLKQRFPEISGNLFLLSHIPDQGEDFYRFVSGDAWVYEIEVPRDSGTIEVANALSFMEFRARKHSRSTNRTLDAIKVLLSRLRYREDH